MLAAAFRKDAQGATGSRELEDDPLHRVAGVPRGLAELAIASTTRLARLAERRLRRHTSKPGRALARDRADPRARNLAVGEYLLARFRAHLQARAKKIPAPRETARQPPRRCPAGLRNACGPFRSTSSCPQRNTRGENATSGSASSTASCGTAAERRRSIVWVFEGWDVAGKGGAIRRLTDAIDARDYRVIPGRQAHRRGTLHHYLWRFWRHVPRAGMVTIYDRSWYGRVLVERLEGYARDDEWRRAFGEINDFETQLTEHGIIVLEILAADREGRAASPLSRSRGDRLQASQDQRRGLGATGASGRPGEIAVGDMLALTNHGDAPWHLVPANNKRHARLQIIKASCKEIEAALGEQ